jgi:hypothetical protein
MLSMHNIPHTKEAKKKMSEAHKGKPAIWRRRPSKVINGIEIFRCGRCKKYFPREGFYHNKRTILGLTHECRKCHTKTAIASRDKIKARRLSREYGRRARKRDPEKINNREKIAARKRKKNIPAIKARARLNWAIDFMREERT